MDVICYRTNYLLISSEEKVTWKEENDLDKTHFFQGNAPQKQLDSIITHLRHVKGALVPRITLCLAQGAALSVFKYEKGKYIADN